MPHPPVPSATSSAASRKVRWRAAASNIRRAFRLGARVMEAFSAHNSGLMDSHVIIDLGCAKSVCGIRWLSRRLEALKALNKQ